MGHRITQAYLDVWVVPTSMKARETQDYLDSWVVPTTAKARLTQEYLDSWVLPTSGKARVSQAYLDVWAGLTPPTYARITQDYLDVWTRSIPTRLAQVGQTTLYLASPGAKLTEVGLVDVLKMSSQVKMTQAGSTDVLLMHNKMRVSQSGVVVVYKTKSARALMNMTLLDGDRVLLLGKRISRTHIDTRVIDEDLKFSDGIGTLTVELDDPQFRVYLVEFQTRNGADPLSPWLRDATEPYQGSVGVQAGRVSMIAYRVTTIDDTGKKAVTIARRIYFDDQGRIVSATDYPTAGGEFVWGPMTVDLNLLDDSITISFSHSGTITPATYNFLWKWTEGSDLGEHSGPGALAVPQFLHRRADTSGVSLGHKYDLTPGPVGYHPSIEYKCFAYDNHGNFISDTGWVSTSTIATLTTSGPHS
jgi:hypothetical protein